jgi:hypothetical protein
MDRWPDRDRGRLYRLRFLPSPENLASPIPAKPVVAGTNPEIAIGRIFSESLFVKWAMQHIAQPERRGDPFRLLIEKSETPDVSFNRFHL